MSSSVSAQQKASSLVDTVHAALRERILIGQLPGGSPLTEVDIAAHYSVARPTAKAAMERLVFEGLLTRSTNKTARVPVLTTSDVRDLYFARAMLEGEIVELLATRRFVPDEAREHLRRQHAQAADPEWDQVAKIDGSFHRSLVDALASPRLSRLYRSMMGEVHLCMAQVRVNHLQSLDRIAEEHEIILTAIGKGDVVTAVEEMNGHLDRACHRLLRHMEKAGHPIP